MSNLKKNVSKGMVALAIGTMVSSANESIEALAETTCSTEEECKNLINETKQELSQLEKETAEKEKDLTIVEENLGVLITRIEQTQAKIKQTEAEIKAKESEISQSENQLKLLEGEITNLKGVVSTRMRMSQRLSRTNIFLDWISEATSLVDLIRSLQIINHFAENDSQQMDNLRALVKEQNQLMTTLKSQREALNEVKVTLEADQKQLAKDQQALEIKKAETQKQIQALESEKLSAEEVLDIAQSQKALLEKLAAEEEARRQEEERRRQEEEQKRQEEEQKRQEEANSGSSGSSSGSSGSSSSGSSSGSSGSSSSGSSSGSSGSSSSGVPIASTFIIPLKTGYVSCEFMCYPDHTGIDLGNSGNTNTPVLATASGVVTHSGWHHAYGNHVMITHNINGKIMTTVYAHMHTAPYVSVGDIVSQGQQLGTMGNTGNSQGAHLHFEMYEGYYNYPYAVNPRKYIHFPSRW